jgi:hypothetical protein
VAAFLAELASELCYAELLGRSVGVIFAVDSSGFPYRSPPFSTRHSDAPDETAVPRVSASGNRRGLHTRSRCAKIEGGAEKEKQRWVF